ncbi:STAS domain-containing protein [Actinoplanes sp. NPDC023801]|uniref:STAS domain-containing protein n=1 Tax=Actinoplanes sp. NPDC023801 TaxID=3154595 RepID=UPI0034107937
MSSGSATGRVVVGERVRDRVRDRVTAVLSGDLDGTVADEVGAQLRLGVRGTGPGILMLDMAVVDFCDVAGLRALLAAQAEGSRIGCRVVISAPSEVVVWLLDLTGLGESFGYPPGESIG